MTSTNEPSRFDKKERLLDAAAEAFWVNGFAATSLADIASQSGVPLGNIYYYFKTKAAIAEGVAGIFLEETLILLEEIDETFQTPHDKIRAMIATLRDSAESRTKLGCPLACCLRDFSSSVPEAAKVTNQVFETLVDWISRNLSKHGDDNALLHARTSIARWQGAIILAHGASSKYILIDALDDIETDLLARLKASDIEAAAE